MPENHPFGYRIPLFSGCNSVPYRMDVDSNLTYALIYVGLVLTSAIFVAAEYAILTNRRRRVEQVDSDLTARGVAALTAAEEVEEISLLAQLGGLLATLLLGVVTADWARSTMPSLPSSATIAIGLGITAVVHLILGQQIPRFVGANHAGWIQRGFILRPLRLVAILLRPIIVPLSLALDAIAGAMKLSRAAFYAPIHTPADIRELVRHGHEQGVVEEDESEMIHGVFDFSDTVAREVMTPRIDIVAVPADVPLADLLDVIVNEGHSRIPVYDETIDNIIGVLLAKDLLPVLAERADGAAEPFDVRAVMRDPYFVPDSKPVDDILAEFRQSSVHLAIVIDEFGGTYGLVTMEDLLEEIVGEINDEYDVEEPEFAEMPDGDVLIDGGAAISDVNDRYDLAIPEEDFDTIGGYIFGTLGRVPIAGDAIETVGVDGEYVLAVEAVEDRRVTRIRLRRTSPAFTTEG